MATQKQAKLLKRLGYDSEQIERMSNTEARDTIIIEMGTLNEKQYKMETKKYDLDKTDIKTLPNGVKLYRIIAVKDFSNFKKGEKGGYIEKESNLSQTDNAWVYGNACVSEKAKVFENALVYDNAQIYGNAKVFGNAKIFGNAKVYYNAYVTGDAEVYGNAEVYGHSTISGCAKVLFDAKIYGYMVVFEGKVIKPYE